MESVATGRPFALEYRLVRRDGSVRWVLERGLRRRRATAAGGSTARSSMSPAPGGRAGAREHEVIEAQLAEVRASRTRILDAADRARRDIERNLHDGAQQRLVSVALGLHVLLARTVSSPAIPRAAVGSA